MTLAVGVRRNPFAIVAARLDAGSEQHALDRERDEAYADVGAFARHTKIQSADGDEIPFVSAGWAWQFQLLALWVVERLSVVLKARQLGVSWLAAIYALWFATRKPGQSVLVISRRQDDADKFIAKIAYIWERLPAWRPMAVTLTRSITFPGLGSSIEAMPATQNVGRSRTAQLVILDEHAHQPWARQIFLAIKPVAEKGQIISLSSANGQGALHSQLYLGAKAGTNGWKGIFIPFSAHPDRRAEGWRDRQRAELEQLSDAEFAQEYPANDVEAIIATGRVVFRPEDLQRQAIRPGLSGGHGITYFREAQAGHVYIIGADVGEGLATSDWSSASVLDRDSGDQVACIRGRWTPDVYATKLDDLARRYGAKADPANRQPVIVGVERNNHGHAVLLALSKLWTQDAPYRLFRAKDKRLGWLTTNKTRPVLVDQLEAALRLEELALHDAATIDQFSTFAYNDDGRPEAQEGYHDDDVMANGIAVQIRRRAYGRILDVAPRDQAAA